MQMVGPVPSATSYVLDNKKAKRPCHICNLYLRSVVGQPPRHEGTLDATEHRGRLEWAMDEQVATTLIVFMLRIQRSAFTSVKASFYVRWARF